MYPSVQCFLQCLRPDTCRYDVHVRDSPDCTPQQPNHFPSLPANLEDGLSNPEIDYTRTRAGSV